MKNLLTILILFPFFGYAQSRIIINNNCYTVIDNGAILIIDNPNPNALATIGGGNIKSENELDRIKWNIGVATGIYTIPWTTNTNIKIPLEINKTTTGTGAGSFILSTYETATDMNTPWPTGITNMNSSTFPGDGSLNVIDRFWHIDALTYTAKPNVTLSFGYDDAANEMIGTNIINETNLQAQRYNTSTNNWEAFKLFGTVNTITNRVSGVVIPSADFFEDWILVDNTNPLPVTLSNFSAKCATTAIIVEWTTQTEINNDYFIVEKSYNGIDFFEVAKVDGNGNSNISISYQINVEAENQTVYFRLKQIDFNGQYEYSDLTTCNCSSLDLITISPNPSSNGYIDYEVSSSMDRIVTISIINDIGQSILSTKDKITKGTTKKRINTSSFAKGNYLLMINTEKIGRTQKKFIIK
jgi:hypothetical protein